MGSKALVAWLSSISLTMSGCAHRPADFKPAVDAADKQCTDRHFDRAVPLVTCFRDVETPLIAAYYPAAKEAFASFSQARLAAATRYDADTQAALENSKLWERERDVLTAVLKSEEPRLGKSSVLSADINGANVAKVCAFDSFEKNARCDGAILRPIWERDANDTISYYDKFLANLIDLGIKYDSYSLNESVISARLTFNNSIKEAIGDLSTGVKLAEQKDAQRSAEREKELSDFVSKLTLITAAVAVAVASPRGSAAYASQVSPVPGYPQPAEIHCTSDTILRTTYTDCR